MTIYSIGTELQTVVWHTAKINFTRMMSACAKRDGLGLARTAQNDRSGGFEIILYPDCLILKKKVFTF